MNVLFLLKYLSRFLNPTIVLISTVTYILCVLLIYKFLSVKRNTQTVNKKYVYWLLVLLIICIISTIQHFVDPNNIQVDRWSAIHNFISFLTQGKYPYLATTHLGGYGSPFPVWQLFHIPFYWMGDVAFAFIFVLIILSFSLIRYFKSYSQSTIYFILLVVSPAFWYEVFVRSDLMYNFIICFIICTMIYFKGISKNKHIVKLGIISGLLLSTRLSVIIPIGILLFQDFTTFSIKEKIKFIAISLFTFCLTFLPFILWDVKDLLFFEYNPFILQTRQGSIFELIILGIMVVYFSNKTKGSLNKGLFFTSITIVLFVATTFIHRMINQNFEYSLFSSMFDITYFNMALPFVIFDLSKDTTRIN